MDTPAYPFKTWRLWVAYDGSEYVGWQIQPGKPSVEDNLKKALERVVGHLVSLRVAGRTDAGVHARGQAVSVRLACRLSQRQMVLALATQLPPSIVVTRADIMPEGFDARLQSVGKQYVYRILQGLSNDPFEGRYTWHIKQTLDIQAMQTAANVLVGEKDFESFRSASCVAEHARRYIWSICIQQQAKVISIDIRGNAFCHNMVRIIVGTLVDVGRGKLTAQDVERMLLAKDRTLAGQTAKPYGLSLEKVYYPDELQEANIPPGAVFPRYPVTNDSWPFSQEQIMLGPTA